MLILVQLSLLFVTRRNTVDSLLGKVSLQVTIILATELVWDVVSRLIDLLAVVNAEQTVMWSSDLSVWKSISWVVASNLCEWQRTEDCLWLSLLTSSKAGGLTSVGWCTWCKRWRWKRVGDSDAVAWGVRVDRLEARGLAKTEGLLEGTERDRKSVV